MSKHFSSYCQSQDNRVIPAAQHELHVLDMHFPLHGNYA